MTATPTAPAHAWQSGPSTLDLLKLVAVTAMIVDHVGLYFYPEQPVLRALGRPAAVIFGFLIGYSATTRVPPSWIGLGLGLTFLERALAEPAGNEDTEEEEEEDSNGDEPIALDILIGLALTRIVMPFFAWLHAVRPWLLVPAAVALALAAEATNRYFEYGTEIAVVALIGLARRLDQKTVGDGFAIAGTTIVGLATIGAIATSHFGFGEELAAVMVALLVATFVTLMLFERRPLVGVPTVLARPLCFVGRVTLWIYAVHLALFQIIAHFD